jgi:adenine-specific DNA-methyltransferase
MTLHNALANERDRLVLQVELDQQKTSSERNKLGQFATPLELSMAITRYALSLFPAEKPIYFADPAIGTGSFFSALLQLCPKERVQSATGIEIDPRFVDAARTLWTGTGLRVIPGDFTDPRTVSKSGRPNLILTNPPYVRHHHINRERKARLQLLTYQKTGYMVSGLSGLYVYFFLLATDWLADDGIAAWLIPSEFMEVNYGTVIRRFLLDQHTLLRIHRFDPHEVQFDDALTTSAVVVFQKGKRNTPIDAEFSFGGSLTDPARRQFVSYENLRDVQKWTAFPGPVGLVIRAGRDRLVMSDLFKIRRGVATGATNFFVLPRAEAETLQLPLECLRPILPSPRYLKITVLESDSAGYPLIDKQLALIDCSLPAHEVASRYPALWAYLQTAEERGILNGYLVSTRSPWYRQEQRAAAPFLCTYMGRGSDDKKPFRFIWNKSQAIAPNVYLMLYPVGPLARVLAEAPSLQRTVYDLLSDITADELRGGGRVYGGGLRKMEPSELGMMSAGRFAEHIPHLSDQWLGHQQATLPLPGFESIE